MTNAMQRNFCLLFAILIISIGLYGLLLKLNSPQPNINRMVRHQNSIDVDFDQWKEALTNYPKTTNEWNLRDLLIASMNKGHDVRISTATLPDWFFDESSALVFPSTISKCPVPCHWYLQNERNISKIITSTWRAYDALYVLNHDGGYNPSFLKQITGVNITIFHGMEPWHNGRHLPSVLPGYDIYSTYSFDAGIQVPTSYVYWQPDAYYTSVNVTHRVRKNHTIAWIFSNIREERIKLESAMIEHNFPVDIGGSKHRAHFDFKKAYPACGSLKSIEEQNNCYYKNYLFVITFESASDILDYSTEKLWDVFAAGAIPIIVSGPSNIRDYIPDHSVIFFSDYKHLNDLKHYLDYLSTNETAYMSYHAWRSIALPDAFALRLKMSIYHYWCNVCIEVARLRLLNTAKYGGREGTNESIALTSTSLDRPK